MVPDNKIHDLSLKPGGAYYEVIDNNFNGRCHSIIKGMIMKELNNAWFQVFRLNNHGRHCVRVSPDFINEHSKNLKKIK